MKYTTTPFFLNNAYRTKSFSNPIASNSFSAALELTNSQQKSNINEIIKIQPKISNKSQTSINVFITKPKPRYNYGQQKSNIKIFLI